MNRNALKREDTFSEKLSGSAGQRLMSLGVDVRLRFSIAVAMTIHLPGIERATAEEFAHRAHQVCPYSNWARGNIDVLLTVAKDAVAP
jgi:organic hydroperoxide reductase OsmC/OhrA